MFENSEDIKQVGEIKLTNDLSQFKFMKTNRPIDPKHVNDIRISIEENGSLVNPIMVNKDMEVVDGQNRLLAFRKAGKPVYYYQVDDYGIDEVRVLNIKQKNWNTMDYLNSFVAMGYEDYIELKKFHEKYSEFTLTVCIALLSNKRTFGMYSTKEKARKKTAEAKEKYMVFSHGTWKIGDAAKAIEYAGRLRLIGQFYPKYYKSVFVGTMLTLFENENFVFEEFMEKLKKRPDSLVDCNSRNQYKTLIEKIYNHRRKETVNLRY
jgi:hypothetical protein